MIARTLERVIILQWFVLVAEQISGQEVNRFGFVHESSCTNHTLRTTWAKVNNHDAVYNAGADAMLGAVLQVRAQSAEHLCGLVDPMGLIQLEALLWTVEMVNRQQRLENSFTFGIKVKDDCGNATIGLAESMEFVEGALDSMAERGADVRSCLKGAPEKYFIVLGGSTSSTSLNMAGLLKLFKIPQISHAATDSELEDTHYYPYFTRTVPSDGATAIVLSDLISTHNWTFINIIYESDTRSGEQRLTTLTEELSQRGICVDKEVGITYPYNSKIIANQILDLSQSSPARVTVLLTKDEDMAENILEGTKLTNLTSHFLWIGVSDWSRSPKITQKYHQQIDGSLTIEPHTSNIRGNPSFAQHLKDVFKSSVVVHNLTRNPWLMDLWEETAHCKFPNQSHWSPHTCQYDQTKCTGRETLLLTDYMRILDKVQPISDAVLAAVNAIKRLQVIACPGTREICASMKGLSGEKLLSILMDENYKFRSLADSVYQFESGGQAPSRFSIYNYRAPSPGVELMSGWMKIGRYDSDTLQISSDVKFTGEHPDLPSSECSAPCAAHQAKIIDHQRSECCWKCQNCTQYEYLFSEIECRECPQGELPLEDKSGCYKIEPFYMDHSVLLAVIAMAVACVGILLTIITAIIFMARYHTPVVRASGRELTFVLLAGILLCYLTTFVMVAKPSLVVCILQNTAPGLAFTICYTAILLKANRIYRIFEGSKKSRKTPKLVSPQSQLILCLAIVSVQVLISLIWVFLSPPMAGSWHPDRDSNYLVCLNQSSGSLERSHMIGLTYPILLLVVCTAHAVLTRNIPGAFNESKLIGLTVYTTCVIWLAFVPIYYTTSGNITVMMGSMCFTNSLSATVSLCSIFFPKLYIIVIRPEKNVRSRTKGGKLSATKTVSHTTNSSSHEQSSSEVQRSLLPQKLGASEEACTDEKLCEQ